jgi:5-(carboxyamino)imidazole ribonucleotide synthase
MRIGIIGGGQLGRMLALAAYPLGAHVTFLDPAPDAPMSALAKQICGAYDDERALEQLARESDVVTYEFENVPVAAAQYISKFTKIFPPPDALRVSQDRWHEKTFFQSLNIPTPKFARVDSLGDLENAIQEIGLPAVLKTRRLGYDGKGQSVIRAKEDIAPAWDALRNTALILEAFVDFSDELSVLGVRRQDGECAFYPLVENHHREGILRLSLAPSRNATNALQNVAQEYARRVLNELNYVGVLAIEFFRVGDELVANEMAPRVHNSGHWTIEGAETSQFENHIRAVAGLPLGSTQTRGYSAMMNCIGTLPDVNALLQIPDTHVHLYDKAPRPGRKLGHVTIVANDEKTRSEKLAQVNQVFPRAFTQILTNRESQFV